ncbi:MAG TPA: DJ-1/PfpI family protein [Gaiellaceae bacterium]|nr:DJ-1/PfpI family protein [Gaiellaceae bacterium]
MNIGIFIYNGAEELDFAGPFQVLTQWARQVADEREIFVFTVAQATDPVRCSHGLRVVPDYASNDCPPLDLLLFPGGQVNQFLEDEQLHGWIRGVRDSGALMTSVCTGAHVYASAGVLENRPATTWYGALDSLVEIDPTIELRRDDRFVDSGEVVTSAGVSAGIDMALHLVARLDSRERAEEVRRYMQYETPVSV